MTVWSNFWQDEDGLTTVEYALLLALIAVAGIVAWTTFGNSVRDSVSSSNEAMAGI